jgi:hypothetical protein
LESSCSTVSASDDHHRALPKIASFRDWLLAEAAEDVRRLKTLADRAAASGTRGARVRRGSAPQSQALQVERSGAAQPS